MRGKPLTVAIMSAITRITPADAGKTDCCIGVVFTPVGSPPRMRGKHQGNRNIFCKMRITPADAGKTSKPESVGSDTPDHPRGCGENAVQIHRGRQPDGSPPRMRGKQGTRTESVTGTRITPADAGKTLRPESIRI